MIKSMTGYGRAVGEYSGRNITVEVRSVNHRYFDCSVKTSRFYSFLEDPIKKAAQNIVSRGKVDVFVSIDNIFHAPFLFSFQYQNVSEECEIRYCHTENDE